MTDVLIPRKRLRELEIAAEMGANIVKAINEANGDLVGILAGTKVALAHFQARMAVAEAMAEGEG